MRTAAYTWKKTHSTHAISVRSLLLSVTLLQILQLIDANLGDGTAPVGMGSHEVFCLVQDETTDTTIVSDGTVFVQST